MTRTSWCATSIRKLIKWNSCSTLLVFLCLCFALSCALLFVFLIDCWVSCFLCFIQAYWLCGFVLWVTLYYSLIDCIVLYCIDLFSCIAARLFNKLTYLLSPCCRAGIFIALVHVYALLFLFNFEQTTDWLFDCLNWFIDVLASCFC